MSSEEPALYVGQVVVVWQSGWTSKDGEDSISGSWLPAVVTSVVRREARVLDYWSGASLQLGMFLTYGDLKDRRRVPRSELADYWTLPAVGVAKVPLHTYPPDHAEELFKEGKYVY